MISYYKCQRQLAMLWLIAFLGILILLFLNPASKGNKEVWEWFFQTMLPNIMLILSVLIVQSTDGNTEKRLVSRIIYLFTFIFSIFYCLVVFYTIELYRLIDPGQPIMESVNNSKILFIGCQSILTLLMGFFFFKEKKG